MVIIGQHEVKVGDTMFDIIHGKGKVVSLMFNEIKLRLDKGITFAYTKDGYSGGVRRLYWHSPIMIEPPKDKKKWDALSDVMLTLSAFLE